MFQSFCQQNNNERSFAHFDFVVRTFDKKWEFACSVFTFRVWYNMCEWICVRCTDNFNMIMSFVYMRRYCAWLLNQFSWTLLLRHRPRNIRQNDVVCHVETWRYFRALVTHLGLAQIQSNIKCTKCIYWCRCVCAYWDYVLKYLLKDKVMKIENISNDMICSIRNTNEFFESTQCVDSRQFQ